MSTDTPTPTRDYSQLARYGELADAAEQASNAYATARETIAPAKDANDAAQKELAEFVNGPMGGWDPAKLVKKSRGGGGGKRDPERRQKLVDALTAGGSDGSTVKELVESSGLERSYIASTVASMAKSGKATADGPRGEKRYALVAA